jgi:MerR family transcriptional regulator, light-induced transcriptional regulator
MPSIDQVPTFNLKAVVQETGLKPDTLRAWERRYGLPQPARTSGGHRLYSQRDIDMLNWLIERQEEGLSISRAVEMWKQLLADGKEPLLEMAGPADSAVPAPLEVGSTLAQLRESWIEACLAFDEQQANYVLAQTFALYPPETGCIEVLQKGLSQIGERWYQGEVTVQQEHFASVIAMRRLEALLAANPAPTQTRRLVIACPPQEEHTFSPLLLTLLLRRRGWGAIYLGADVPLAGLESMVRQTRPDLVVLIAQMLPTAATMHPLAAYLHEEGIPLAFGGRIFNIAPSLRTRLPGHFLGEQLEQAPYVVEQLLTRPVGPSSLPEPDRAADVALQHFRARQPLIEAAISERAAGTAIAQADLARANRRLAEGIMAALELGDITLLEHDLAWVAGLMVNYNVPGNGGALLDQFLQLYRRAAQQHLDERGALVVAWLEQAVGSERLPNE